ncbi:MAG: hypothetical protein KDC84_05000 [Crocinitomicaceae bacterium]|nr:hypothetical protein [Crocinitomicaceae bacterium]
MKIRLLVAMLWFSMAFGQDKKGTITVEKETISGLYVYKTNSGSKTYIRIFKDSMVMIANNSEGPEYMMYWFDRMARDSNLPQGKAEIKDSLFHVRIKVAQSIEDDIILDGMFLESNRLKVHRKGQNVDNKEYIFTKIN